MVADRLRGVLPADVELVVRGGDMLALIDDWAGFDALVCVDAAAPAERPARIFRLDLSLDPAGADLPASLVCASSHALGLAEAVALARTLGCAPARIIVFAVEGACFDCGAPISASVLAVADDVAGRVVAEVARLRT